MYKSGKVWKLSQVMVGNEAVKALTMAVVPTKTDVPVSTIPLNEVELKTLSPNEAESSPIK